MKKLILVLLSVVSIGFLNAQVKIAHVDSQKLLDTMPSRKAAVKQITDFQTEGAKELQEMQEQIQNLYTEYDAAQKNGESPLMLEMKAKKIQAKEQSFQDRQSTLQQDLQVIQSRLNEPILKKVQDAVKIVADRKKLNYVLDISSTLYASGEDITSEVLIELLKLEAADKTGTTKPATTTAQ
jgi:outer membrane protein